MFQKAKPIWEDGKGYEKNTHLVFKAQLDKKITRLKIASSVSYQVFINGKFKAIGPARCGKDHFYVDDICINDTFETSETKVEILCFYYGVPEYNKVLQKPFLCCEIYRNEKPIAYTGSDSFKIIHLENYIQNTSLWSLQRGFAESYVIDGSMGKTVGYEIQNDKKYLKRLTPYPLYEETLLCEEAYCGKVSVNEYHGKSPFWYDEEPYRTQYKDYMLPAEQIEEDITKLLCGFSYSLSKEKTSSKELILNKYDYKLCQFPSEKTGVISFTAQAEKECDLWIVYDEILCGSVINPHRLDCNNAIRYRLSKGKHYLVSFEPVSMKHIAFFLTEGSAVVSNVKLLEYSHPPIDKDVSFGSDKLDKIYDAAVQTFRQNALDILMDCPSRERAGYFCDSYFTARVEHLLTGANTIEKAFFENYLCEDKYDGLPDGMVPMCYPATHSNGVYIPNWAMWLVLELEDYQKRTGDNNLVERFRKHIYRICDFFRTYENDDGLLENLESWIFVEWSKANEFVKGVNYPSNMVYYAMLKSISRIYNDALADEKAEKIKKTIIQQSFNGVFFRDDNVDESHITEVCQYYAFYMGIANREEFSELWNILLDEFGPISEPKDSHSYVFPANVFIGHYLRMELLLKYGYKAQLLKEIENGFLYMAETTGTLWEKLAPSASCNHGFASYIAYLLKNTID